MNVRPQEGSFLDKSDERPNCASVCARRVVLLGASNLIKGVSTVVGTAGILWGSPLEVWIAGGHGRSYGAKSVFFGRALPGITECGLWEALATREMIPTAGLITDIGNDLLYNQPVERIAGWVETCLQRLAEMQARTVMTLLPVANIERLGERRFKFFRTLFFPPCRLSLAEVSQRAMQLNDRVRELAVRYAVPTVTPNTEWYGLDPIHIKQSHWPTAWREILATWNEEQEWQVARSSVRRWLTLRMMAPQRRWLWHWEQRREQPAAQLLDGSVVAMY